MLFLFLLGSVFLDDEVVDDEVLALHGILAHIVLQKLLHLVGLVERHLLQADVGADEAGELLGRDFAEALEAGNLRVGAQFADGRQALLLTVAVAGDEVALGCWVLGVGCWVLGVGCWVLAFLASSSASTFLFLIFVRLLRTRNRGVCNT